LCASHGLVGCYVVAQVTGSNGLCPNQTVSLKRGSNIPAACELPVQQVVAEASEIERSQSHQPVTVL
jgi:hypothetical protein